MWKGTLERSTRSLISDCEGSSPGNSRTIAGIAPDRSAEVLISMMKYMCVEVQVDADFSRARRKAALRRLASRLRRDPTSGRVLCFEEIRRKLRAVGGLRMGPSAIRLSNIVGSVGRSSEFDRDFMPTRSSAEERWKRIDRAFHRGEELPPVNLSKLGGLYFVLDGHHRVSVARYHGVEWIDAEVTEFRALLPKKRRVQAA